MSGVPKVIRLGRSRCVCQNAALEFSISLGLVRPGSLRFCVTDRVTSVSFFQSTRDMPICIPGLVMKIIIPRKKLVHSPGLGPNSVVGSISGPSFRCLSK